MSGGWVYIMTNRPNGVLYTGVTSDIGRRAYEHRERLVPGFTKRYGLKRLVYMEFHERIADAIQRKEHQALASRLEGALILESESGMARLRYGGGRMRVKPGRTNDRTDPRGYVPDSSRAACRSVTPWKR